MCLTSMLAVVAIVRHPTTSLPYAKEGCHNDVAALSVLSVLVKVSPFLKHRKQIKANAILFNMAS